MPIFRITQNSFTSGQASTNDIVGQALEGRSNLEVYQSALRTCSNFIPLPMGPLFKRPGLKLVGESPGAVKIAPFVFNESQTYLFVFRNGALDVYRNDVAVATNIVVPWTSSQLATMKFTQSKDLWIGFHDDVPMTSIKRGGNDATWTVSSVAITNAPTFDFGSGAEAAWSNTRGYPKVGTFHQNRLVIGGAKSLPETVWGSRSGILFHFTTTPVADDMSWSFVLGSTAVHTIQDCYSIRQELIINTSVGEWTESSAPITPSNVLFRLNTRHGMINSGIRSLGVDSANVFVDRRARLRSFGYDFNTDSFIAKNLSVLAPGLLKSPTDAAYVRGFASQANLCFFRNSDGTCSLITIDFEQRVQGWATLAMAEGTINSICSLDDTLYALVSYNSKTWLAKLTTDVWCDLWSHDTSATPKDTWTGFTAHASKMASVIGDGLVFRDVAIDANGDFTLPSEVSEVYVGVAYTALAECLPISPVVNGQLQRGNNIRLVKGDFTLRNTQDFWVNGTRIALRSMPNEIFDAPPETYDTMKRVWLGGGWSPEPILSIESRDPLPCTVLGFTVEAKTSPSQ